MVCRMAESDAARLRRERSVTPALSTSYRRASGVSKVQVGAQRGSGDQSRQYTGAAGKVTKCQAGVSLHLANERASAAVNWRLYLPASWDPASPEADADKIARRGRCGIPAQAGHVEKLQLALDMIDEARS
ncbi:hypothetical protein QF030_000615 [Streptomyces rishiriensis]|uniref:Transposase IS701-like DDE domain-containing protein n=1 Tax=Streptomyces rishiriensis TaxID=68264 RepID=A0ABU0NH39_STRRH|nr:hypothetical protein [Streptomyces rishiriensis]